MRTNFLNGTEKRVDGFTRSAMYSIVVRSMIRGCERKCND
jgi:hypothetical protein